MAIKDSHFLVVERENRYWDFEFTGTEKDKILLLHLPPQLSLLEFDRELGCGSLMQSSKSWPIAWERKLQY